MSATSTVFLFIAAAVGLTDAGRLICGANTWQPSWASSPDAACALWAGSTSWGALKNGQTLEEASADDSRSRSAYWTALNVYAQ